MVRAEERSWATCSFRLEARVTLKPVACLSSPLHQRRKPQESVLNAFCMGVAGGLSSLSPLVALLFSSYSPLVLIPFSRLCG
jgi:hypothetical protein